MSFLHRVHKQSAHRTQMYTKLANHTKLGVVVGSLKGGETCNRDLTIQRAGQSPAT